MPYLTLFLVAAVPLALEALLGRLVPTLWHRPRWLVLPAAAGIVGWLVPLAVLPMAPWVEHGLGAFLGVASGLLVALFGAFRARFWTGPSEADLAMTGRRSMYAAPGRRTRH